MKTLAKAVHDNWHDSYEFTGAEARPATGHSYLALEPPRAFDHALRVPLRATHAIC